MIATIKRRASISYIARVISRIDSIRLREPILKRNGADCIVRHLWETLLTQRVDVLLVKKGRRAEERNDPKKINQR